jgi:hypothetical protein
MIELQSQGEHTARVGVFKAWLTRARSGLDSNGLEAAFFFKPAKTHPFIG